MNLFAGAALALAARRSIQASPDAMVQKPFMNAASYLVFVFLPMGGFLVYLYPAWSWMYLVNPAETPVYVSVGAVLLYPLCGFIGYLSTERLLRRDSPLAWLPVVAGGVGSSAVTLILWERLVPVGRYAEWELDIARPMWLNGPWMWDMFLIGGVITGTFLLLLRTNSRLGKPAAA